MRVLEASKNLPIFYEILNTPRTGVGNNCVYRGVIWRGGHGVLGISSVGTNELYIYEMGFRMSHS